MGSTTEQSPSKRRYPPELKERAVRMVFEVRATGEKSGAIGRVARQLGIGVESLRLWVSQAEVDGGQRPGTTTADASRIRELSRRSGSCAGPMRSCARQRFSSRGSSTPDRGGSGLHRHPS